MRWLPEGRGRRIAVAAIAGLVLLFSAYWFLGEGRGDYFSLAAVCLKAGRHLPKESAVFYDGRIRQRAIFPLGLPVREIVPGAEGDAEVAKAWWSKRMAVLITTESRLAHWRSVLDADLQPQGECGSRIIATNFDPDR